MKISAMVGTDLFNVSVERDDGHFVVEIGDKVHRVDAHPLEGDFYSILSDNRSYEVSVAQIGDGYRVRRGASEINVKFSDPGRRAREAAFLADGPEKINTAMPGRVVRLLVAEGVVVVAGQGIVVIEAMKMENEITCTKAGTVKTVHVKEGQSVEGGAALVVIE